MDESLSFTRFSLVSSSTARLAVEDASMVFSR
jgi:hypothetical protein